MAIIEYVDAHERKQNPQHPAITARAEKVSRKRDEEAVNKAIATAKPKGSYTTRRSRLLEGVKLK